MALGRLESVKPWPLWATAVPRRGRCVRSSGCVNSPKVIIGHPAERRRQKTIRLTRSEGGHHLRILRGNEPVS